MKIDQMLLTPNPYSRPEIRLDKVTKVAVHYTGNPGSTAKNNRDYFENLKDTHYTYVSSHYVVGLNGEVIQCIPENEWSYCTNQANGYSISIETCHPDKTGKFNAATEQALAELVADICKRHGLDPIRDVIRHYDVTGKHCPLWYVTHPGDWDSFRERVKALLEPEKWAVRVQHFDMRARAEETAGQMKALGFYNEIRTDPANGKYVVDVFSFIAREKAAALAWALNNTRYSIVRKVE